MTSGDTVYASRTGSTSRRSAGWRAIAAARDPRQPPPGCTRSRLDDGRRDDYVGSGEVPGYLLNQWSLSEHEGMLRAATTSMPPWESDAKPRAPCARCRSATGGSRRSAASAGSGRASGSTRSASSATRLRRHVPPGRPALHARPLRPDGAARARRAQDPRLLGLPAPARRRTCCSASGRTRPRRAARTGMQLSLFDVSDLPRRAPARPGTPSAQQLVGRRSTTTTRSCGGRRSGSR